MKEILGPANAPEQLCVVGREVGHQRPTPGEDEIVSRDRIAAAPHGVFAQVKRVRALVSADGPALGGPGFGRHFGQFDLYQRLEQTVGHANVQRPGDALRIEEPVLTAADENQVRTFGMAGAADQPDRQHHV